MSSVADFLVDRLHSAGIKHVFGIAGSYILDFCDKLSRNQHITLVNTTDEAHAGFAANAYARVNGSGCVCVTYNVGALKVANAVACAYAERSPMVVISGAPGLREREEGVMLHHTVRNFNCQKEIFDRITCFAACLDSPSMAGFVIDQALDMMKYHKRPVYLELPRDMCLKPLTYSVYELGTPKTAKSNSESLKVCMEEVKEMLAAAKNPVVMAGVELARYGLGERLLRFLEHNRIPVVTELLSKSVVPETHPLFAGLYCGGASRAEVQERVENSDCLIMLGMVLTDVTLNFSANRFKPQNMIFCNVEEMRVRHHYYRQVQFLDFCDQLFRMESPSKSPSLPSPVRTPPPPASNNKITTATLFERLNHFINQDTSYAVLADVGDGLFGAGELTIPKAGNFISPASYTSMGFAIPGALGVQLANPSLRPLVIAGDGSFQMTLGEISTIIDRKLNPIIVILNNRGYATERLLRDGPFNDIRNWKYHAVAEVFGGGSGFMVNTEAELEQALNQAKSSSQVCIINVQLDKKDVTASSRRLMENLSKKQSVKG